MQLASTLLIGIHFWLSGAEMKIRLDSASIMAIPRLVTHSRLDHLTVLSRADCRAHVVRTFMYCQEYDRARIAAPAQSPGNLDPAAFFHRYIRTTRSGFWLVALSQTNFRRNTLPITSFSYRMRKVRTQVARAGAAITLPLFIFDPCTCNFCQFTYSVFDHSLRVTF